MPRKSKTLSKPHARALALALPRGVAGPVRFTFDAMEIAEEEIRRRYPRKASEPRGIFGALLPTDPLIGKSLDLYRAHVRELLERSGPLAPATSAECLAVLCDTSLKAPLHAGAARAMETLFARVLPRARVEGEPAGRDTWPGQAGEIIADLRRKFAMPARDKRGTP